MPLLDHFRPPIELRHGWRSFLSNWATRIADDLNAVLPETFLAEELTASDHFEVRVTEQVGGMRLVAAIELVSPGNKDRPEECQAFAQKIVAYLHQGVAVVVIDIVTTRRTSLHNETVRRLGGPAEMLLAGVSPLYAVSYRPVLREAKPGLDLWPETFDLGDELPTMPLRLTGDTFAGRVRSRLYGSLSATTDHLNRCALVIWCHATPRPFQTAALPKSSLAADPFGLGVRDRALFESVAPPPVLRARKQEIRDRDRDRYRHL